MTEEVRLPLVSTADTSGFEKFQASYNSLAAAKGAHARQNDLFVDSERRVRSNLEGFVKGLGDARDATQATSQGIAHLSEVFALGFTGTIVAGVASTLIDQFGKVDTAVKKVIEDIQHGIEKSTELVRKLEGLREGAGQPIVKQVQSDVNAYQKTAAAANANESPWLRALAGLSDVVTKAAIRAATFGLYSRGPNFGGKMDAAQAQERQKLAQYSAVVSKEVQALPHAIEEAKTTDANALFGHKLKDDEDNYRSMIDAQNSALRETIKNEGKPGKAKVERPSESEDDGRQITGYKPHLTTLAGSQRQQGGGGRAYSVLTFDPVVEEARKHTILLTQISNSLKEDKSSVAPGIAQLS